jgi:hypothetical protein
LPFCRCICFDEGIYRCRADVLLVRLFWLGEIKDERPEFCPRFFKVDLAPHILEFLSRDDGEFCGELMNGADCVPTLHSVCLVPVSSDFVASCGKHSIIRTRYQEADC